MNKHLQDKQMYDSIYNEEDYPYLNGDEPCFDPDCVDEEAIYDVIGDEYIEDYEVNEFNMDEDEEYYL